MSRTLLSDNVQEFASFFCILSGAETFASVWNAYGRSVNRLATMMGWGWHRMNNTLIEAGVK